MRHVIGAGIVAAVLTLASAAAAQGTTDSSKLADEILQHVAAHRQAMLDGDASRLEALLADELTFITAAGLLVTKAQMVAALRTRALEVQSIDLENVRVRVYGSTAVVTGIAVLKERFQGAEVGGRSRFTRVYVKDGGGWKLVAIQATRTP